MRLLPAAQAPEPDNAQLRLALAEAVLAPALRGRVTPERIAGAQLDAAGPVRFAEASPHGMVLTIDRAVRLTFWSLAGLLSVLEDPVVRACQVAPPSQAQRQAVVAGSP